MAEATTTGIIVTAAIFGFIVFLFVLICICYLVSRRNRTSSPGYQGMSGYYGGYGGFGGHGPYGYGYGPYGGYWPYVSVAPGHVISTQIQNPPPPAISPAAVVQPTPSKPAVNSPAKTDRTTSDE